MDTAAPAPATPARRGRLRRVSRYGVVAVMLGIIGAGYGLLAPHGQAAEPQSATSAATIAKGHNLFIINCASCHGLNAEGGNRAPSLIGVGAAAVDFQVGTGRMPLEDHGAQAPEKPPRFDQAQIDELAAYVASLGAGPAIPTNLNYQKANVSQGLDLWQANCAHCHQVAAQGGVLSYGSYAPSLDAVTPKQMYEAMITGPENMPVFGDKTLTPAQKLDIIKYITTMRSEANPGGISIGRTGPVAEGAVAWLAAIPVLVLLTLWIGKRI